MSSSGSRSNEARRLLNHFHNEISKAIRDQKYNPNGPVLNVMKEVHRYLSMNPTQAENVADIDHWKNNHAYVVEAKRKLSEKYGEALKELERTKSENEYLLGKKSLLSRCFHRLLWRWKPLSYTRRDRRERITKRLIKRDGTKCGWCHEELDLTLENRNSRRYVTIDHIQPLCKGGGDNIENLRLLHQGCNNSRGAEERMSKK